MTQKTTTTFVAIITGGGRGIGRVISIQLAASLPVLLVGRTEQDLAETCAYIEAAGGKAAYTVGDVSQAATAQTVVEQLKALRWTPRHLICNAGIGKSSLTHELDLAQWRAVIDTNLHGSFYFVHALLPAFLRQQAGTICFVSSIAGVKGYAHEAAYVASKHATVGLAKSLALEYGKHGLTVVPICPGFVEGEMTTRTIKGLAGRRGIPEKEAREVIARLNPQRRIIPEQEVADMVDVICSGKLPSLNGSPIMLSGGA